MNFALPKRKEMEREKVNEEEDIQIVIVMKLWKMVL
jgi:hypothetical protein